MNTLLQKSLLLSVLALLASTFACATGTVTPNFNNFKVTSFYQGAPAQAVIKTDDEKTFRTRLRESAKQPVNFAGQHVLTTWGCGTGCLYGAAINQRTGVVTFLPGTISGWQGQGERVMFHRNSRLLMLAGVIDEGEEHGLHYYELVNDRFTHVSTIPVPSQQ